MATSTAKDDSKDSPSLEIVNTQSHIDNPEEGSGFDDAYLHASKTTKLYRGVLFQMILFGA